MFINGWIGCSWTFDICIVKGRACSSDECGGRDPCLSQSELTKPTVADLHDKSGEKHLKSIVKTLPGNCLAGYPLHPICLAGPFGEVQVLVGELLPFEGNIPGFQSRMAAHSLSCISSPGVLR